jgi:serine/threonine protein kinase
MSETPSTIGRYRIEAVLGRGAMGLVYRGHDPEIDRPVAIKLVRADLLSGGAREEYLARFRQEARAAGRCTHPNIVAIYDYAIHDDNPYLTMEFVEGENLGQAFDRGLSYTPGEAVAIILQVLEALTYAHERGIVHRDIKPANIIVLASGAVKVADFGISRLPGSELTLAGSVMGTPSYMSPEQCKGEEVDHRSDLFSVGAVLFQLLTGEKAFTGDSVTEIVHKLLTEDPPELAAKGVRVPAAASAALRRALAKQPVERFASAREMARELRRGFDGKEADDRTIVVPEAQRLIGFERDLAAVFPAPSAGLEPAAARINETAALVAQNPHSDGRAVTDRPTAPALQREPDPTLAPKLTAKRSSASAMTDGASKGSVVGAKRQGAVRRDEPPARQSAGSASSIFDAGRSSIALLLRLCSLVTAVLALVLLLGGFGALVYQTTQWLQYGHWPDLRLVQLWHWMEIDPQPISNLVGPSNFSMIVQLPLWIGLLTPGLLVSFISGKCSQWLRQTAASR